jgi:tetratricopeptide (TPR) repeat protein
VRLKPGSAEIHYNLGKVHSAQDNYPPAKRAFEEAVRLNSSYMEAFNGLGFVMEALGEDEAAVENYQKAAQLNEKRGGDFALPYVNLGSYYNRINRHELAIEYAQKALKFNPKSDSAYFQMAKAHRYREEWSQAAEALETAISINSFSSQYYYLLGTAYRQLGKDEQSQQAFATFQKMEQESADFERKRRETRRNEPSAARSPNSIAPN